jgi:endoglucanase
MFAAAIPTSIARFARRWAVSLAAFAPLLSAGAMILALNAAPAAARPRPVAHAAYAPQCADPYGARRDPANPLMLPQPPGADPLNGANFFVDGPAHGAAAGAVARLLGFDVSTPVGSVLKAFSDSLSWITFSATTLLRTALEPPSVVRQIRELEKIAVEPEVQRISIYSQGGGPGAIFAQAEKLFCHNFTADPGSIPIISTYFLHPALGGCATPSQINAAWPAFRRRVDELAAAIGNRPVVLLLETDAFGSSACMARMGDLGMWEADVRYEVDRMAALPHTVVYVEAGYSDANSAGYTARALNQVDIGRIRGFFTNDTHQNWTINEVRWADKVSRQTHGANYIVNTAQNGNGPLLNPDPVHQGVEDLCNPPGRGLGPKPTTNTGVPHADAFLWTSPPGNSSGTCNGGTASGTFWAARAVDLATNANNRLGPGFPSQPY